METFKKRQKEMKRLERQRDKAARRMERKQIRAAGGDPLPDDDTPAIEPDADTETSSAAAPTTDV